MTLLSYRLASVPLLASHQARAATFRLLGTAPHAQHHQQQQHLQLLQQHQHQHQHQQQLLQHQQQQQQQQQQHQQRGRCISTSATAAFALSTAAANDEPLRVAVVGAGVTGAVAAYSLAQKGALVGGCTPCARL